ncbi:hypothetical protein [Mucilaginibacter paludis]|uniref:Uncharacterized protein n=1 Tax=Mucilaginibacter paludis DSM 18603 TaxID=714943 RepID=H1Y8P0_9SPHI|nr:hypothetical protein [Mucilaginibacter paludis]EHQ26912.1 hypothetical protein Mucpa_2801 [Mucilaginibacter paludis DSM 18603]
MNAFKNNSNFSPGELEEISTDICSFFLNNPEDRVKEDLWLLLRAYIYNTSQSGGASEIGDMLLFYEELIEVIEALAKLASFKFTPRGR